MDSSNRDIILNFFLWFLGPPVFLFGVIKGKFRIIIRLALLAIWIAQGYYFCNGTVESVTQNLPFEAVAALVAIVFVGAGLITCIINTQLKELGWFKLFTLSFAQVFAVAVMLGFILKLL